MGLGSIIRYVGLMMILSLYIASGVGKLVDPDANAKLLAKSNFPYFLKLAGVHLSHSEYRYVIQATAVIFLSFSAFILLGIGRSFFAFLLAMGTVVITVCFFVNVDKPMVMKKEDQFMIMKNTAITGGLLFVAGSGHKVRKPKRAGEDAAPENRAKKTQ